MRNWICLLAGLAMMVGVAHAQANFPVVDVVEQVADSVVSIDANQVAYGAVFGQQSSYERLLTNRVTGFVYTENGYIITDTEAIQDAFFLTVLTNDGRELSAEVIGTDEDYGVAIIKADVGDEPLKPVDIVTERYDYDNNVFPYEQGDGVIAIGYSGGFGGTVTYGIISEVRNFRNRNQILVPSVIQSDVVINAGNEGCPLFNTKGQVIGFNDIPTGMQQVTFFLPMWIVTDIADQLISNYESARPEDNFEVWHPWLGIKPFAGSVSPFTGRPRTVDPALKMYLNIPDQYWDVGVLIDEVWPESPAFEYGILPRDMIMEVTVLDANEDIKIEHMYIEEIEDLELLVTTAKPDEVFIFGILRFGTGDITYLKLEVVVGQHPGSFQFQTLGGLRVEISTDYF